MFTAGFTVLGVTSCPAAAQLNYVSPIFCHQMAGVVHISKPGLTGHFFFLLAREKHKFTSLSRYLQTVVMVQ